MDVTIKTRAIEYQALSEAEERDNELFLSKLREWLELENVSPILRQGYLRRIEETFRELGKVRRQLKALMDIDAAQVA